MIEFFDPPLRMTLRQHMNLVEKQESCSSCVGFCVALGKRFFSDGIDEVDESLVPLIEERVGNQVLPRVLPNYAILLWFALQVWINAHTYSCT